jgi:hypothetical protein
MRIDLVIDIEEEGHESSVCNDSRDGGAGNRCLRPLSAGAFTVAAVRNSKTSENEHICRRDRL